MWPINSSLSLSEPATRFIIVAKVWRQLCGCLLYTSFDRIRELEKAQAVQREQYDTILEKLAELARSISELSAKPGKRWESIVDKSVWAVLAAVIAFLLARIGL